jgi:hypothetical protein
MLAGRRGRGSGRRPPSELCATVHRNTCPAGSARTCRGKEATKRSGREAFQLTHDFCTESQNTCLAPDHFTIHSKWAKYCQELAQIFLPVSLTLGTRNKETKKRESERERRRCVNQEGNQDNREGKGRR